MQHNCDDTLSNFLDESYPQWYTEWEEGERIMFNPLEIMDKKFTVTFIKQDGTTREITGYLVEGGKYSKDYVEEYCVSLVDKTVIPMITDKGWRSFITTSVISVEVN